jgi:hypothetical protein
MASLGNLHKIKVQGERLVFLEVRYHPFASRLRSLARQYQSQAVLRLVEEHY